MIGGSAAFLFAGDPATQRDAPWISDQINTGLPVWLRFGGEERIRAEAVAGQGFRSVDDQYVLNRLRLNVEVRPFGWLRFQLQAQDARVFGQNAKPAPASQKDAMDLRLGYVQIGSDEGRVKLRAGRQSLDFGEGRLLADPAWSNVGRTFDAARVSWQRGRVKLDLFTGAVVKANPVDFDRPEKGRRLHGAYGTVGGLAPGMSVEPYLFWRTDTSFTNEGGRPGKLNEKIIGLRWFGDLPFGFDYAAELSRQTGSAAGDRIAAWMAHWVVGYTLEDTPKHPRLFFEYNRASGDSEVGDGRHGTFDPLFPSSHDKYGLVDLFGSSNIIHVRPGFQYNLHPRLRVAAAYGQFWLSNACDGLYVSGKVAARSATGVAGADVGREADVQALWTVSRVMQVNAGYGRLFPGAFLRSTTPGVSYGVAFLNVMRRF